MDPHVSELLEIAKREIEKVSFTDQKNETEVIVNNSILFADKVLKLLIAHTLDADIKNVFEDHHTESGFIRINDGSSEYDMYLDIVDKDYMLDLIHFNNNVNIRDRMVFLLNTVKVLFPPLKDYIKNSHSEFNYVLQIDPKNTTLFLNPDMDKRIGIMLVKRT